ncbi:hypothetical protein ABT224_10740 [Streptomyces sp. NPDC001584]|uniref:hypothetical protein n=1 Tax=Streptomyces sp. NPDC001584 TaxID=3154521 RepID=UPI003318DFB1
MPFDADTTLLYDVTAAVKTAGVTLRGRYTPHARGVSPDEAVGETHANDDAVLDVLREPLLQAGPDRSGTGDTYTTSPSACPPPTVDPTAGVVVAARV